MTTSNALRERIVTMHQAALETPDFGDEATNMYALGVAHGLKAALRVFDGATPREAASMMVEAFGHFDEHRD
jgi:hypothetical protein